MAVHYWTDFAAAWRGLLGACHAQGSAKQLCDTGGRSRLCLRLRLRFRLRLRRRLLLLAHVLRAGHTVKGAGRALARTQEVRTFVAHT